MYKPLTIVPRHLASSVVVALVLLAACNNDESPAERPASTNADTTPTSAGDSAAPALSINMPTSAGTYTSASASVSLSGSASDNVGVTQVSWSNNRGGSGSASLSGSTSASWSAPSIPLLSGTNTISITARDAAGNSSSSSLIVSYGTSAGATYFLSPSGNNSADCKSLSTPCKSFATVFPKMAAGDELISLDGTYSAAAGTGSMNWNDGAYSAQIPSGTASRSTYVHALNPGKVTVQGGLFIGRSTRKDSYITVQGITFEGGAALYNTSFVTLKDSGVHGSLDVGTGDHTQGNTDNLIEDVWVWAAEQRIIAINYRADRNVWRRVVVRGDGCSTTECLNNGAPNVGITVYESRDVSLQNVIVVDRILSQAAITAGNRYADFATAQHTADASLYLGRNEWLGCISINGPDSGFQFEADATIASAPTWTLRNVVAIGSNIDGINVGYNGRVVLENATTVNSATTGDGLRVAPGSVGTSVANIVARGFNRGLNSSLVPSYTNAFGSPTLYNQTTPTSARTTDPMADGSTPSLKHPVRIEAGSALKGAGSAGADIGANIVTRYGSDGARQGASGYNALSSSALWPWPNEDRIKRDMCANTTRGFCSSAKRLDGVNPVTLSSYIWEALGNPVPAGIYP